MELTEIQKNPMRATTTGADASTMHRLATSNVNSTPYLLEFNNYPLLCRWIQNNSSLSHIKELEATFIDESGVKRYTDTWLPVTESFKTDDEESSLNEYTIKEISIQSISHGEEQRKLYRVKFLTDWERLFKKYHNDMDDEIALHAPLLKLFIDGIFHNTTLYILSAINVYNCIAIIAILQYYEPNSSSIDIFLDIVNFLAFQIIYLAVRTLYKGAMFGEPVDRSAEYKKEDDHANELDTSGTADRVEFERKVQPQKAYARRSLHWFSTIVLICKTSWKDTLALFGHCRCCKEAGAEIGVAEKQLFASLSYYQLLNTSLKFMTRHCETDLNKHKIYKTSYRLVLLFVLYLLPIYLFIYNSVGVYQLAFSVCQAALHESDATLKEVLDEMCNLYLTVIGGSFGYLTIVISRYICASAVVVALLGLVFGAEIAYTLTDCWIRRFIALRRTEVDQVDMHKNDRGDADADAGSTASHNSDIDNDNDSDNDNDMIRNVHTKSSKKSSEKSPEKLASNKIDELTKALSRDAFEQYAFIKEYMHQAGSIWSPAFIGFIILAMYLLFFAFYNISKSSNDLGVRMKASQIISYFIYTIVRLLILFVFPVCCLAHANGVVFLLQEKFKHAVPNDFAAIGGRTIWTEYLNAAPMAWVSTTVVVVAVIVLSLSGVIRTVM